MQTPNEEPLKRVLIVEEEQRVQEGLVGVFKSYSDLVEVRTANDAGQAIEALRLWSPNLMVLDLMMPYGTEGAMLDEASDPHGNEAGIRVLEWTRRQEETEKRPPLWVAVVTARADIGALQRVLQLMRGQTGWLFQKPFDSLVLEVAACDRLGLDCQLPPDIVEEARGIVARPPRETP